MTSNNPGDPYPSSSGQPDPWSAASGDPGIGESATQPPSSQPSGPSGQPSAPQQADQSFPPYEPQGYGTPAPPYQPDPGYGAASTPGAYGQPPYQQNLHEQQNPYEQPSPYGQPGYDQAPYASYGQTVPYGTQPYAANPYAANPYSGPAPQHPQAVLALVFGIIGLPVICFAFSIPAMIIGRKVQRETSAEPTRWSGGGMGTAGFVMGLISTILWVLYAVFVIIAVITT